MPGDLGRVGFPDPIPFLGPILRSSGTDGYPVGGREERSRKGLLPSGQAVPGGAAGPLAEAEGKVQPDGRVVVVAHMQPGSAGPVRAGMIEGPGGQSAGN